MSPPPLSIVKLLDHHLRVRVSRVYQVTFMKIVCHEFFRSTKKYRQLFVESFLHTLDYGTSKKRERQVLTI